MVGTRYSAFISYRHQTPDQEIAQKLHRLIESYTIPSALRQQGSRHLNKVFRDQEELPLSADLGGDIESALDQSDWLICICSPRYVESKWCLREVEYFVAHKGRDRVLTVLAEGEPAESFPETLLFETDEQGNKKEREPLAANVRGETVSQNLKALKKEKYRILAPMLNVSFDGLYQRQRRRTMRNALAAALSAMLILGGFLAYALVQNGKITRQNEQITAQNEQIVTQNNELTEKNEEIAAQNIRIEEERTAAAKNECDLLVEKSVYYSSVYQKQEATRLGLEALSVSETLDGYGRDSILEALTVSCSMGDFAVEARLNFPGIVNYDPDCLFSPDGSRLLVLDSRSGLSLCNALTGERLWVSSPFSHDITSASWKADGSLIAVTAQWGHTVCLIDAATGEHLKEVTIPWACNAVFDGDDVIIAFSQGAVRWEPSVSDEDFPWVFQIEQDQQITSKTFLDGQVMTLCQGTLSSGPRIFLWETGSKEIFAASLPGSGMISGYTVSPDGEWLYVHQFHQRLVVNPRTDEIRWQVSTDADSDSGMGCEPVWVGDVILDCGAAYDAVTGDVLYTMADPACVGVSPDGQYFASANAFYRLSDGSWFAQVPGTLKAIDPTGKHLVVFQPLEYGKGAPGNPDAVISRRQAAYLEQFPGTGSQYTVESYTGALTDIPDWTEPETEDGMILALHDPYGTGTTSYLMSKSFISPDGRYCLILNQGGYIPIYDLKKSSEPSARIYDFSVGDHVEAVDAGFSADGRLVAIAGAAGQAAVYELASGSLVCSFTDTYLARSLSEAKFDRSGRYLMVADWNRSSFRVYSVTNGQTLYTMHATGETDEWGFDEETGDAVVKYTDGSALIARMFTDGDTLLEYARDRIRQADGSMDNDLNP